MLTAVITDEINLKISKILEYADSEKNWRRYGEKIGEIVVPGMHDEFTTFIPLVGISLGIKAVYSIDVATIHEPKEEIPVKHLSLSIAGVDDYPPKEVTRVVAEAFKFDLERMRYLTFDNETGIIHVISTMKPDDHEKLFKT